MTLLSVHTGVISKRLCHEENKYSYITTWLSIHNLFHLHLLTRARWMMVVLLLWHGSCVTIESSRSSSYMMEFLRVGQGCTTISWAIGATSIDIHCQWSLWCFLLLRIQMYITQVRMIKVIFWPYLLSAIWESLSIPTTKTCYYVSGLFPVSLLTVVTCSEMTTFSFESRYQSLEVSSI